MGKMSREKGKRGELRIASMFREAGFSDVHRTAQFRGNTGAAGDLEGANGLHIEVKFQEQARIYDWMEQAKRDSTANGKGNMPVVIHKQNNKEVLCIMRFEDFIEMYREWSNGKWSETGISDCTENL